MSLLWTNRAAWNWQRESRKVRRYWETETFCRVCLSVSVWTFLVNQYFYKCHKTQALFQCNMVCNRTVKTFSVSTCSHVVSLCTMWEKGSCTCDPPSPPPLDRLRDRHLMSATLFLSGEIMDLECFCSERKTSVPTLSAFDLIAPSPPHSEIICPLMWCSA